jgi:pimeloyl-ACP methyl ester carboxylesterase
MFHAILRRVFRQVLLLSLLLATVVLAGASWIDREIFSPSRRALQSYHLERLQHPAAFGLKIRSYGCLEGKVPCLLVEPDAQAGAGERGRKLRQQLADKGITPPAYGQVRGTMVLLHGRNMRKEDLLPVAERFVAAGFRCLIPDLPAHGDSPLLTVAFGGSAFERSLPRKILADARQHFVLPAEPAALWGMSMGGAFAVSAANESPQTWEALIVVSSFGTLEQVMDVQVPRRWKMLVSKLFPALDAAQQLRGQPAVSHLNPQEWAQGVHTPALVVHGTRDAFIPLGQGRKLYDALASPHKRWLTVDGGGHANVLRTAMPLYAEMGSWLLQTIPPQSLANNR